MKSLKNITSDQIIKIVAFAVIGTLLITFICNLDLTILNRAF